LAHETETGFGWISLVQSNAKSEKWFRSASCNAKLNVHEYTYVLQYTRILQ